MLSVHRTPIQPRSPSVVERGRSRDIPPAAIARRASEERRQSVRRAAALAVRLVSDAPCTSYATSVSPSTLAFASRPSPTARGSHPPSTQAVASSTSCRLPSPLSSLTPTRPITNHSYTPSSLSRVIDSPAQLSYDPQPQPAVSCKPYTVTQAFVYQSSVVYDDTPLPPRSLQDQMQEAYAADNMHLARVLYLKIQGIEVTNDDDPRIAQVRDEDFVFVPGGELVLDDEALAVLNEERARREKEMQARKQAWEAEAERVRVAKARRQGETRPAESTQRLEFMAKGRLQWLRGRPLRTNLASRPFPHNLSSQSSQSLSLSRYGLAANFRATVAGTPPARVSLKEVVQRLQGSLFADAEPSETRRSSSGSQDRLLDTLLQAVEWQDGERGRAKGKGKEVEGPQTWTNGQLCQSPGADATCLACSVGTDSTISRTNSWASTTSDASVTTCISSPATSPHFGSKLQLPPLMNDKAFRKLAVHSCRPLRRSNLTAVPLMESPLLCKDAHKLEQGVEATRRSSHERNNEHDKLALITRVRQSVAGLVDFASKIQQSYLRTIQFTVTMPRDAVPPPSENSTYAHACPVPLRLKPAGYRASACDVQRFAPRLASAPTRELNFPSETNIPLESHGGPPGPARVFAPLAFVPPSPLRPRHTPAVPEWRLRPVANPCTLRLRALANRLAGCGIPWEGRSHTGSLGCGRERLTGVAFEGLGGSRLAFEAK